MPRQRLLFVALIVAAVAGLVLVGRAWGVAAALLLVALAGLAFAFRRAVRDRRAFEEMRRRAEQLERFLGDRRITPVRPMPAIGSDRRDITAVGALDDRGPAESIESILRMARDQMGAEEAVLFRISRERDTLTSVAWASEGASAPQGFREEWHRLVEWTAREQVPQCSGPLERVNFAVAPQLTSIPTVRSTGSRTRWRYSTLTLPGIT